MPPPPQPRDSGETPARYSRFSAGCEVVASSPNSSRAEDGSAAFSKCLSRISPIISRKTWTICRSWRSTSGIGIETMDSLHISFPIRSERCGGCFRLKLTSKREQRTLVEAWHLYRDVPGVRVPRLLKPLCTSRITALTEEQGVKVTNAAIHLPEPRRTRVAERLVETLIAVPLLSAQEEAIFHGDPHAATCCITGAPTNSSSLTGLYENG